jgi:hypothetical protein
MYLSGFVREVFGRGVPPVPGVFRSSGAASPDLGPCAGGPSEGEARAGGGGRQLPRLHGGRLRRRAHPIRTE